MDITYARYKTLVEEVLRYDIAYYTNNNSLVDDFTYDAMVEQIRQIEEVYPTWKMAYSPSVRIGAPDEQADYKHKYRMYSLNKAYDLNRIRQWYRKHASDRMEYYASIKLDGIAVDFEYDEQGTLMRVTTRGTNGISGQDITEQVKYTVISTSYLRQLTPELLSKGITNIYGEVVMNKGTFTYLSGNKKNYVSPRNAASGILTGKLMVPENRHCLFFHPYDARPYTAYTLYSQILKSFTDSKLIPPQGCRVIDQSDIESYIEEQTAIRNTYPYEIDGLVFRIDPLSIYTALGYTEHDPRGAIAYKFAPKGAIGTVDRIERRIARDGKMVPVAVMVEPVIINGISISCVTLHNEQVLESLGIVPGCRVSIIRQGDVIPKITEVLSHPEVQEEVEVHCGYCGEPALRGDLYYFCPNTECPGRVSIRLHLFAGKHGINIKGIGQSTWDDLVDKKKVVRYGDILSLKPEDFLRNGAGAVTAIQKAKAAITVESYLTACGIEGLGAVGARALAKLCTDKTVEECLSSLTSPSHPYASVRTYFSDKAHQEDFRLWFAE